MDSKYFFYSRFGRNIQIRRIYINAVMVLMVITAATFAVLFGFSFDDPDGPDWFYSTGALAALWIEARMDLFFNTEEISENDGNDQERIV